MADVEISSVRSPEDWVQIREICCLTGAAGKPVEPASRWPFFGELWIGPYQKLLPEWTLVARAEGRVVGYLTGCPASAPFSLRKLLFHRVPLAAGALLGRWGETEDVRRFLHPDESVRRNLALRFGGRLCARLFSRYPAHLHINVRDGYRGGTGRRIMDAYVRRLEAAGVSGLHLFCGANPVPFYRRTGFRCLASRDFGKGPVFVMARRLRRSEGRPRQAPGA